MKKAKSIFSFKWLWILLALSLFITVLQINKSRELRRKAGGMKKRIEVAFYGCYPKSLNVGDVCQISALVYDENNQPVFGAYHYYWSLSSSGSLGELKHSPDGVATFKVRQNGVGDLVVRAQPKELGVPLLKSIKIIVGEHQVSNCQREGKLIKVTPYGEEGECHDIQQAINVARSGDQIRLSSGTFPVKKQSCTLPFTSGAATAFCGLEIIGQKKNNIRIYGSGRNHTILDFEGSQFGIVLLDVWGVTIHGVSVTNTVGNYSGIGIYRSKNIIIEDNRLSGLDSRPILANASQGVIIARNDFENNTGAISGVHFISSEGIVSSNLFVNTKTGSLGTASSGSKVRIINNTIVNNLSNVEVGGGVGSEAYFKNNIVANSRGDLIVEEGNKLMVDYNDFWQTQGRIFGSVEIGVNNLFVDPLFGDDYCLMPGSPAIGAGEGGVDLGAKRRCPQLVPKLNFKIKFEGVADKVNDQLVKVVIKNKDIVKEYRDVKMVADEQGVLSGEIFLEGVTWGREYYLNIKGPKHLSERFCVNNQAKHCRAEQMIVINQENSFDFSHWPLLPGDIPDKNGLQNGVVDARDFSVLKRALISNDIKLLRRANLDFNQNSQGREIVNGRDISLFLNTMSIKYDDY